MLSQKERTVFPLTPKLTDAIWGGGALVRTYHKAGDPNALLGESWECWDDNAVARGAFCGSTVAELRADLGRELTGPIDPAYRFPMLTKLIDAHQALSVQVHPNDVYAQEVEDQPFGKTECWYILAAEAGAELVLGWTRDTDREEFVRRVGDGTLGEILRRVPVRAGDAFYLPAGTLHAIGAGIQLFETQQASDLTYRIFDWNRVGPDGRPRALHVEKAGDVLDFAASQRGAVRQLRFRENEAERGLAIAEPRFAVERIAVPPSGAVVETAGRPLTITPMGTGLHLRADATEFDVGAWESVLVPAALDGVVLVPDAGGSDVLVARAEPDLDRLREDALRGGCSQAAVDEFFAQFG